MIKTRGGPGEDPGRTREASICPPFLGSGDLVIAAGSVRKVLEDPLPRIPDAYWSLVFPSVVWGGTRFSFLLSQTEAQAAISGPTVKNNSLHGNIPLVKVDAATNV